MNGGWILSTHVAPAASGRRPKRSGDLPLQQPPHSGPVSKLHIRIVRQLRVTSCLRKEGATTTYVRTSPASCRTSNSLVPMPTIRCIRVVTLSHLPQKDFFFFHVTEPSCKDLHGFLLLTDLVCKYSPVGWPPRAAAIEDAPQRRTSVEQRDLQAAGAAPPRVANHLPGQRPSQMNRGAPPLDKPLEAMAWWRTAARTPATCEGG